MLEFLLTAGSEGGAASEPSDAEFPNVTFLSRADGSNGQGNDTFVNNADSSGITDGGTALTNYQGLGSPTGIRTWCNHFNGTNQQLTVSVTSAYNFTGDFTVEAWVRRYDTGTGRHIVGNHDGTNASTDWRIFINASGQAAVSLHSGTEVLTGSTTGALSPHKWYHIAVSRSGSTVRLFVDGVLNSSTTDSGTIGTTTGTKVVRIGSSASSGTWFHGLISNVRIVSGTAVYTSAFTPPTTQLTPVSGTSLLCCHRAYFRNEGEVSLAGTITNSNVVPSYQFGPVMASEDTPHYASTFGGTTLMTTTMMTGTSAELANIGTGDFTIEGWVYVTGTNFSGMFTSYPNPTTGSSGIGIIWETSRVPFLATGANSSGNFTNLGSGVTMALNRWYHLAATRESGTIRIFVDGELKNTGTSTRNIIGTAYGIGNYYAGANASTSGALNGRVSGIRVVVGQALYTSTFTPSLVAPENISGTAVLFNSSGAGYVDQSGHVPMKLYGGAVLTSTYKKFGPTSLALNGTTQYAETEVNPGLFLPAAGEQDWTIEAWVRPAVAQEQCILGFGEGGTSLATNLNCWMDLTGANQIQFQYTDGSTLRTASSSGLSISHGTSWNHVAITFTGATSKLEIFANGVRGFSGSIVFYAPGQKIPRLTIGRRPTSYATPRFFNGSIDDVRVTLGVRRYTDSTYTVPTESFPIK